MENKLTSEELESVIHVLGDIKDCLRSDRPADDFITKWEEYNADVPDARTAVRTVYADEIEKAELILKKILIKKKLPVEREPSAEECILVLENLKGRTKFYPEILGEYPEDYIKELTKIELAVFDKLIFLLKNLE